MSKSRNLPRCSFAKPIWGVGVAATLLVASAGFAQKVEISGGDCAPVHLVARNVPLSAVLAQLAKALDFKVSFQSDSDPLVDVDTSRSTIEMVMQLAPAANVSMIQASNPRCPDRDRITELWVLPAGSGGAVPAAIATNARPATPTAEKAKPTPKATTPPLTTPPSPSPHDLLRPPPYTGEPGNPEHPE